ncbi:PucR family transcriptional regulator [Actinopolymorpha alba]|uniref:PucR family transcriptional regulator n=1 Tax=Actinopolymorpha alba TaxID=533267 RepID=UPI001ED9B136|nr:helix-turn-helix domain-containing protein [Actinopolymorpha alba]
MSSLNRATAASHLERASGMLASATIERMQQRLSWFRGMNPQDRSWIGLVAQTFIAAFVAWFRDPGVGPVFTADVLGTAPRELTRKVTLHQTVEMIRIGIEVVEERVDDIVPAADVATVREAVLLYSREIAFGAAEVYARAAEMRGAWDARLEALIVDAVLRGETDEAVRSRVAALGWSETTQVLVVVGRTPVGDAEAGVELIRRDARHARLDVLTGVQGDRLIVILGGAKDPHKAASGFAAHFGPGPVVYSPVVPDLLAASGAARAAIAGYRAAPAWLDAPRPVAAEELLPERALSDDAHARRQLVTDVFAPLADTGPVLLETLAAFFENGGSVEATARMLFVHANTVRYRLRRITELTGYAPSNPRHAYTLRIALTLGRLHAHGEPESE